ncbi:formate dehydrogenase [Paenibacillus sp. J31TS4]|uniref:DinB family protein n=1 Tax=Paenibacillus sp. J31TS4 TaxID=2807195 RepID=UPI001B120ED1|nr:DinB family protein [Paenibacillus sp. J31TS4]GIP40508.1 formate dehydrogenase [Paenibacillus sp. J31TS4]
MSQAMVNTAKTVRRMAIGRLQGVPEELFDVQPAPFNNTIRWNIGHMAVTLDQFLSRFLPFDSKLPESYAALFSSGTRPADWTIEPPSKEELLGYLSEQLENLGTIPAEALDKALPEPFLLGTMRFDTVGEIFSFAFIHEAMHLTTAANLAKLASQPQA